MLTRTAITIILIALNMAACTTQSWYQGAKSSHTSHCMKLPVSEYKDCMDQADETYNEYSKKRDELAVPESKN